MTLARQAPACRLDALQPPSKRIQKAFQRISNGFGFYMKLFGAYARRRGLPVLPCGTCGEWRMRRQGGYNKLGGGTRMGSAGQ